MRVNSRVAERLKTYHPRKLGNNSKILQAHGIIAQRPAPPPPPPPPPKWTPAPEKQKPNSPRSAPPHTKIRTIFARRSILDVIQGPEYASVN